MKKMSETIKIHIKRQLLALRRFVMYLGHIAQSLASRKMPVVKQRYLRTRDGRLRARYVFASIVVLCAMTAGLDFSGLNSNTGKILIAQKQGADEGSVAQMMAQNFNTIKPAAAYNIGMNGVPRSIAAFSNHVAVTPSPTPENVPLKNWKRTVSLEKGGTIGGLLAKNDIAGGDSYQAIKAMSKYFNPRDMKPGQEIILLYSKKDAGEKVFDGMDVVKSGIEKIEVRRNPEFGFESKKLTKAVHKETRAARTTVSSSIYADLSAQGVPDGIINQLIKSYSWAVDFQRDIWGGEEIEVLYTVKVTDDEGYLRSDELLYANLVSKGKKRPMYFFTKKDGDQDFYDDKGNSVRKALLKTPVDGARISSGYGRRKHPVLGYSKMHKGIDFAAPRGTPIYAAGKGIVERASRFGSFGNYVKIRHNSTYETAYAHMKGFARGIRKGVHVKQGQVIGYIGTTGRSTGPHLHYEVHVKGKQVNPQSVDLPIGEKLTGTNLANFKIHKDKLDKMFASEIGNAKLIEVSQPASKKDAVHATTQGAPTISH